MPASPNPVRCEEIRTLIHAFISDRLAKKLKKLSADDPKREVLAEEYEPQAWLESASKRARILQRVTHALKATHPLAEGTSLYVLPSQLPPRDAVGSYVLGAEFVHDIVGAKALDVYKFLKLEIDGHSLLDLLLAEDGDALNALSDDADKAREWRDAFVSLMLSRETPLVSHALAKQLYWLVGEDPLDDSAYHLLAPLYASSLAHRICHTIQEDLDGKEAKEAGEARRKNKFHKGVTRGYPQLAVQKMGGGNSRNVSQLTHERRGRNYLLSCSPPKWEPSSLRSLYRNSSFFDDIYGVRPDVRTTVSEFLHFLKTDSSSDMYTRNQRDAYVDTLIGDLVQLAFEYQKGWEPGWSRDPKTKLPEEEQLWLDPYRALLDGEDAFRENWLRLDWPDQIGNRFARWLNAQLEEALPVGDDEHRYWKKRLCLDETESGWAQQLHRQCKTLDKSASLFISH